MLHVQIALAISILYLIFLGKNQSTTMTTQEGFRTKINIILCILIIFAGFYFYSYRNPQSPDKFHYCKAIPCPKLAGIHLLVNLDAYQKGQSLCTYGSLMIACIVFRLSLNKILTKDGFRDLFPKIENRFTDFCKKTGKNEYDAPTIELMLRHKEILFPDVTFVPFENVNLETLSNVVDLPSISDDLTMISLQIIMRQDKEHNQANFRQVYTAIQSLFTDFILSITTGGASFAIVQKPGVIHVIDTHKEKFNSGFISSVSNVESLLEFMELISFPPFSEAYLQDFEQQLCDINIFRVQNE